MLVRKLISGFTCIQSQCECDRVTDTGKRFA